MIVRIGCPGHLNQGRLDWLRQTTAVRERAGEDRLRKPLRSWIVTDDCGLDPSESGQGFCEHGNEIPVSIITWSDERISACKERFGREYRSYSSLLCSFLHNPVTSFLLGPNIFLSTPFSNTPSTHIRAVPWYISHKPNNLGVRQCCCHVSLSVPQQSDLQCTGCVFSGRQFSRSVTRANGRTCYYSA
jgi:hypothetical protein